MREVLAPAPAQACFTFDHLGSETEMARLYDLLAAHGTRATFFLEGRHGLDHPQAVADLVRRGHELGMHGWAHEAWADLAPADEEALAARATEALAAAAGERPRGFRAPGGARTDHTPTVLSDLGYEYDASLGDGMRPAALAPGLAQVPFVWPGVDGFHYLRDQPADPAEVARSWLASLERVAAGGGLFMLICHAPITSVDAGRVGALDAVIAAAAADPRVELCTVGEVAAGVPTR